MNGMTRNPHRPLSNEWEAWNGGWHAGFNDCAAVDDRDHAIAAGSRRAETRSKAQREASQSGGTEVPHRPNTGGHST
jgi:hypothetical protein